MCLKGGSVVRQNRPFYGAHCGAYCLILKRFPFVQKIKKASKINGFTGCQST